MKYFVYSFMWRNKTSDSWYTTSHTIMCKSVVEIYEHAAKQPEYWAIQSVNEITKEEYDAAEARGILG